jgi:hypothetical protein
MGFAEAFDQLQLFVKATKLNILVWGSGKSNKEHFEKRSKIRNELTLHFANAAVHFSEDPELFEELKKNITSIGALTVPEQELWHLGACDVCVALDTSEGVGQEIAHYVTSAWSYRLLILTNEKYRGSTSFPAMLRKNLNQIFYDENDYISCNLVRHVIARVEQIALGKLSGLRA